MNISLRNIEEINNQLQLRAKELQRKGKNAISELAKQILFCESVDARTNEHRLAISDTTIMRPQAHPKSCKTSAKLARALCQKIHTLSSEDYIGPILQKQLGEEVVVAADASLDDIAEQHPFATKLDLRLRVDITEDEMVQLAKKLPFLSEMLPPANSEVLVVPQKTTAKQLLDISRCYPHIRTCNITQWDNSDSTTLNAVIPQLNELEDIHCNPSQNLVLGASMIPCNASSACLFKRATIGFACPVYQFSYWRHAGAFDFFIHQLHGDDNWKKSMISIALILALSNIIESNPEEYSASIRFVLFNYFVVALHDTTGFAQAFAALQALHPLSTLGPIPTFHGQKLKHFFEAHPAIEAPRLCDELVDLIAQLPHALLEYIKTTYPGCDGINAVKILSTFSKSVSHASQLSYGHILNLAQMDAPTRECAAVLHSHLFTHYSEQALPEFSLAAFFKKYPQVLPGQLLAECKRTNATEPLILTHLEAITRFSQTITRAKPLTPLQCLWMQGLPDSCLDAFSVLYFHLREQINAIKKSTWKESFEQVFAHSPHVALADLAAECATTGSITNSVLTYLAALEERIQTNDVTHTYLAAQNFCELIPPNKKMHNSISFLAQHYSWPKNDALLICGSQFLEQQLSHGEGVSWKEYFTNFAGCATFQQALDKIDAASAKSKEFRDAPAVSAVQRLLKPLLPFEKAMERNDASAINAWHPSPAQFALVSELSDWWNNDALKASVEANWLLTRTQSEILPYFENYNRTMPLENVYAAALVKDRNKALKLLSWLPANSFQQLAEKLPSQRPGIEKMKEDWHRVQLLKREAQMRGANYQKFLLWHRECSDADFSLYCSFDTMHITPNPASLLTIIDTWKAAIRENDRVLLSNIIGAYSPDFRDFFCALCLPLADQIQDATVRFMLMGYQNDSITITGHKHWFRLLSRAQYDRIYASIRECMPRKLAVLANIDEELRPLVGTEAQYVPLNFTLEAVQKCFEQEFEQFKQTVKRDLPRYPSANLDGRIDSLEFITNQFGLGPLSHAAKSYLLRKSAAENYSVQLLQLLQQYRMRQMQLELQLQQIEASSHRGDEFYTGEGSTKLLKRKLEAQEKFFRGMSDAIQAAQSYCRILTPEQREKAYTAAEHVAPRAMRQLLRQFDTQVRFELDPAHLSRGDEQLEIPPAPAGTHVTQLRDLLRAVLQSNSRRILLNGPSADVRIFETYTLPEMKETLAAALPEKAVAIANAPDISATTQIFSAATAEEKIKIVIEVLIQRVLHKKPYFAAPARLNEFYETIERALCGILHAAASADVTTQAQCIKSLLDGIGHCAIRMQFDIINAYKEYALHTPPTATSAIDGPLGELRLLTAQNIPGGTSSEESILTARKFMQQHGAVFGIPGANKLAVDGAPEFSDHTAYDDPTALSLFMRAYNPGEIYNWIEGIHTSELRDCVLNACSTVPPGWQPTEEAQNEITETATLATNLLASALDDQPLIPELRKLGINCPAPANRTPDYRNEVVAAIKAITHASEFKEQALHTVQSLIAQNATDSEIYNAVTAIPRRIPFSCCKPAPQRITPPHRDAIKRSIDQYPADALLAAYRAEKVFTATGSITPHALLRTLVHARVLRAAV